MRRKLWFGMVAGGIAAVALAAGTRWPEARAQKTAAGPPWEYKVGWFAYNPGERLTDDARAAVFERTLNERAREGWEPVGPFLERNTVQSVGGAVTTRDTVSFIVYRRPRR